MASRKNPEYHIRGAGEGSGGDKPGKDKGREPRQGGEFRIPGFRVPEGPKQEREMEARQEAQDEVEGGANPEDKADMRSEPVPTGHRDDIQNQPGRAGLCQLLPDRQFLPGIPEHPPVDRKKGSAAHDASEATSWLWLEEVE